MRLKDFYMRLPAIIQTALVTYNGWRIKQARYCSYFEQALNSYIERQSWSESEILAYRKWQLAVALERASHATYYKKLFMDMGANWSDFLDPREFCKIPIISKNDFRREPEAFRPRASCPTDSVIRTSGTTGTSLSLPASGNVEIDQWAVWWRYRMWHGLIRGIWCGLFAATPIVPPDEDTQFWRLNFVGKEVRFSGFHISSKTAPCYVNALNRFQPKWIHGSPSAISLLATYMLEQDLKINYALRWLTVGSENLQPWQKRTMTKAFGVKPIQHYGLAEAVANISECEYGSLHTDEDFSYVEYVKCNESGECLIVGTPFVNSASALLRYDTGDIAVLSEGKCACGRWGRIVSSLNGRVTDYITLLDGSRVAMLAGPFRDTEGLSEAQIYQDKSGQLTIRYVPGPDWKEGTLVHLEAKLRERVGYSLPIVFDQVERVERTPRGKIKLIISDFVSA